MPQPQIDYLARHAARATAEDERIRIYMSECGEVRVETQHSRQSFAPEEFVARLRAALQAQRQRKLPVSLSITHRSLLSVLAAACLGGLMLLTGCASKTKVDAPDAAPRIVTIGGGVTETAFALGAENQIVGVDTSSLYPEAATKLPQVGYQRQLAAEGVVSLKPTLVLATSDAGTPAALQQIEAAGIKIVSVPNDHTVAGATSRIRQIAAILNAGARGEELVKKLETDLQSAQTCVNSSGAKPKVLFIYARGAGAANVSGTNTAADEMIKLAGGVNAVTGFENYKPLTPEALVTAQPDVILLPALGLQSLGGADAVQQLPGVAQTPAGKNRRIMAVDDLLLLGFTPRLGEGVKDLCAKLRNP